MTADGPRDARRAVEYGQSTAETRRSLWRANQHRAVEQSVERSVERSVEQRPEGAGAADDWLVRARRAQRAGDHHAAAHAAWEASTRDGTAPRAEPWHIRARAHLALGRPDDAVVEIGRAVRLEPGVVEHHVVLGNAFEGLGNWQAAMEAYRRAAELAPDAVAPAIGIASVLLHRGEVDAAVELLAARYALAADRDRIGDALALALVESAERVPAVRDADTYLVTSAEEIARMRAPLDRAAQVGSRPEVHTVVDAVRAHVDRCAGREFRPGRLLAGGVRSLALLAFGLAAAATGAVALVLLPTMTGAAVALAVLATTLLVLAACARIPRWRLHRYSIHRQSRNADVDATVGNNVY